MLASRILVGLRDAGTQLEEANDDQVAHIRADCTQDSIVRAIKKLAENGVGRTYPALFSGVSGGSVSSGVVVLCHVYFLFGPPFAPTQLNSTRVALCPHPIHNFLLSAHKHFDKIPKKLSLI